MKLSLLSWLFATMALAHPGTGLVINERGQVFFAGLNDRPRYWILTISNEGKVVPFVEDQRLSAVHHLAIDQDGNLFAASDTDGVVWKIAPDKSIRQLGIQVGRWGDPFARDSRGNFFTVSDASASQITKIDPQGKVTPLADSDAGYADGKGEQAKFGPLHSCSMYCGPDGSLYLTERSRIRKVAPDGTVSTLAGGRERGFVDGQGNQARFNGLAGVAVDAQGRVYVADESNQRIREISPDGSVVTLAGSGRKGAADGPALQAEFERPFGVAVGPTGDVWVSEYPQAKGYRIRKISADGKVTTLGSGP